jgi:hypothetical protein
MAYICTFCVGSVEGEYFSVDSFNADSALNQHAKAKITQKNPKMPNKTVFFAFKGHNIRKT